jgi:hypothetical protein
MAVLRLHLQDVLGRYGVDRVQVSRTATTDSILQLLCTGGKFNDPDVMARVRAAIAVKTTEIREAYAELGSIVASPVKILNSF